MKPKKKAYVIPHTHWDREWRYPIWKNRVLLIEFMRELLNTLDTDPSYHNFLTDGQSVLIEDYLEVCPWDVTRIKKYVSEGRLSIGPWYTLPDLYPLDGESLLRNLLKGIRTAKKYGGVMLVGYNSFGWGQTAQFPQIYKGFGIDFTVCAKKVSKENAPESEFFWEAPDGTRLLATRLGDHARANFYFHAYLKARYGINCLSGDFNYQEELSGSAMRNAMEDHRDEDCFMFCSSDHYDKENLRQGFEDAWNATEDTAFKDTRLFLNGTDFSTSHPELSAALKDLNEQYPEIEFVNASLDEYAAELLKQADGKNLRVIKGELRDGPACDCSGNALASRSYLKILNKKAERLLIHKAEPMTVFASLFSDTDLSGCLGKAWEYLLKSHPHDSINGVTQDRTADDVYYRLNQACEMGQVLSDQAAKIIIAQIDFSFLNKGQYAVVVFNMRPQPVSEIIDICVATPQEDNVWSLKASDTSGNELASQERFRDEKTYPVHDLQARPWPYRTDRHSIYLETGIIPAFGYKIILFEKDLSFDRTHFYWLPMRSSVGQDICRSDNVLENVFLRVQINPNGTFDLTDKENGRCFKDLHYFEDSGDVGNYWAYYPPYKNKIYTSLGCAAELWCEDNGPLSATFAIRCRLNLPVMGYESKFGVRGQGKRSEETCEQLITTWLTLKKDSRRLEIKTKLYNTAENHRLRLALPTGITSDTVQAAGHFGVDSRPAVNKQRPDGSFDPEMQTLPMQQFVDVNDGQNGLAVLSRSLLEYEKKKDEQGTLYLTLFRAMGNMIVTWWEAVGEFPDQTGSQLKCEMEFTYALYPHNGDWERGGVYREAENFPAAAFASQVFGGSKGILPPEAGLIEIANPALVLSALKTSEAGNSIIVRLYNPSAESVSSSVKLTLPGLKFSEVRRCNLNEEEGAAIELTDEKSFEIKSEHGKIETFEIFLEKEALIC